MKGPLGEAGRGAQGLSQQDSRDLGGSNCRNGEEPGMSKRRRNPKESHERTGHPAGCEGRKAAKAAPQY